MDELIESLSDKVHNKKWWTARLLADLSKKTETDRVMIAQIIALVIAALCAASKQARVICNTIMVVVPLITTFGYPKEAPPKDDMVIYWGVFGILTLGDKELEKFPFYYDFKLILALLLFLEPFRLVDKLRDMVYARETDENRAANRRDRDHHRKKHSPGRERGESTKGGKRGKLDAKDGTGEADDASPIKENLFISEKDVDTPAEQSERKPSMSKRELDQASARPAKSTAAEEVDKKAESAASASAAKPEGEGKKNESAANAAATKPGGEGKKDESAANATEAKPEGEAKKGEGGASATGSKPDGEGKKDESAANATAAKPEGEGKKDESGASATATKPDGEGKKDESGASATATKPEGEGKKDESGASATATKPDGEEKKEESTHTAISPASTKTAISSDAEGDIKKDENKETAKESDADKPHEKKSEYAQGEGGNKVLPSTSVSDMQGVERSREPNPMDHDDFHILRETPGIENKVLDPLVNIHEVLFRPLDRLVFNAPFDFDHVTYHMTIMNNTIHPMAFAIKGNCIPRVIAYPPYGVLKPKQRIPIAVTMRKFDHETYGEKDRIVFEWVLLKKMEKKFEHAMLRDNGIVRRKNILVEYNG